jgi:tRNA threonylcarbamoyladenosine biosynthesis protein TsaB
MIILGIDTATDRAGVALGGHEGVIASFAVSRGRRHVEVLVPAIEAVCRHARIRLDEVSCVAVDVGPGLFTGLRVGVSTARALATALGTPMVPMSSLDLVAFPLRHNPKLVAAVIDAKRGEVFSALYRHVPGGLQQVRGPQVSPPEDLAAELMAYREPVLAVGDGAVRHAAVLSDVGHLELGGVGFAHPTAESLVELAHPRALREEFVTPAEVLPVYLRPADARANFESMGRRV